MREVARVLRPGGMAALEFYNPRSVRGLIKQLKRPTAVSEQTNDEEVYTRYDSLDQVKSYLPPTLKYKRVSGVRVFTPVALVHRIPVVNRVFKGLEWWARDNRILSRLGGFMVVIVERVETADD